MALIAGGDPLRIGVSGASVRESPRSLESAVRRQLGVTVNWRSVSSELLRSWWGALAILPLGVAILLGGPLFPGHLTLSLSASPEGMRSYLETLVQVQAGLFALPIALIIFALEAIRANGTGMRAEEFAEDSLFGHLVVVGVSGVLLGVMALLIPAATRALQWYAVWVTVWVVLFAFLFVWVFARALNANDPARLHRQRLQRLRSHVRKASKHRALENAAFLVLDEWCEARNVAFWPFGAPMKLGSLRVMRAKKSGVVRDVNLRQLERLVGADGGGNRPMILVCRGRVVKTGDPLFAFVSSDSPSEKGSSRVFRIDKPAKDDSTATALDDAHTEAMEAIRNARLSQYERAVETFEEALATRDEFFRSVHSGIGSKMRLGDHLGLRVEDGMAEIPRKLFEEFQAAMARDSREIGPRTGFLPMQIALRATGSGGWNTARSMLDVQVEAYSVARKSSSTGLPADLAHQVAAQLMEFMDLVSAPKLMAEGLPSEQRREGAFALHEAFHAVCRLQRHMIDLDDAEALRATTERWSKVLRDWHPEHDYPGALDLEIAAGRFGEASPEAAAIRDEAAENVDLTAIKTELLQLRSTLRLGLLAWTVHVLRAGSGPSDLGWVLGLLGGEFATMGEAFESMNQGMAMDRAGSVSWWAWYLPHTGEEDETPVSLRLKEAALLVCLLAVDPDGPPPELTAGDWLRGSLHQMDELLVALAGDHPLLSAMSEVDRVDERATIVREALRAAAAKQVTEDDLRMRDSPLDPDKVTGFQDQVLAAWRRSRYVADIFLLFGQHERHEAMPARSPLILRNELLPKEMFLHPSSYGDNKKFAADVGKNAGQRLTDELFIALLPTEELSIAGSVFGGAIRLALGIMADRGFRPNVLLVPVNTRIFQELSLVDAQGGRVRPPVELGAGAAANRFRGFFDDIPVFTYWTRISTDRAYLVDLKALGSWKEWRSADGSPESLAVTIEPFGLEQASSFLHEHPDFRFPGADSRDELVAELQRHVLLRLTEYSELQIDDLAAACWVKVPRG